MVHNRSSAVMAQRHEAHDSLDDFPTPPWATRALLTHCIGERLTGRETCWEPAANRGYMVRVLRDDFACVRATDVHDYGAGFGHHDFLMPTAEPPVDWIITNPPYRLSEQFALRALDIARKGVALLVRLQWLEGTGRYATLFARQPPHAIHQFTERVAMVRGRHDPAASSATAYCWVTWLLPARRNVPEFRWIPPCRQKLERPDDVGCADAPGPRIEVPDQPAAVRGAARADEVNQ